MTRPSGPTWGTGTRQGYSNRSTSPQKVVVADGRPSMGRFTRHEKVGEAEHQVNGEQLRALEPVGSSVAGNLGHDQDREQHHHDEARRKCEVERSRTHEETCEYQDRGHEEGDLNARADRNRQRKVHAVLQRRAYGGRMLSRVSQDRDDKNADEDAAQSELVRSGFD